MKIRLLFLSALLIGTLASFASSKRVPGGLKVQIELPSGVKIDVSGTPVGLYKSAAEIDRSRHIVQAPANADGLAEFGEVEATTYYIYANILKDGQVDYEGRMEIDVVAGKSSFYTLKLTKK